MFWLRENFEIALLVVAIVGFVGIGGLLVYVLDTAKKAMTKFESMGKDAIMKLENPFDEAYLTNAQDALSSAAKQMESNLANLAEKLDQKTLLSELAAWNKTSAALQEKFNDDTLSQQKSFQDAIASQTGHVLKVISKERMFDKDTLFCTEVDGRCKGSECGHYREETREGVDTCRFNALEFV